MSFHTIEFSDPRFTEPGITHVTVKSAALRARADLTCFAPPDAKADKLPLVILLHGIFGSHWAWMHKGGAHRVLERLIREEALPPMMLAVPSDGLWGDGSGYLRHAHADFASWIVDEVPRAAAMVDARCERAPRFLCGLSMGGYAALRLGALHGDRFAAVSGHSSAVEPASWFGHIEERPEDYCFAEDEPLLVLDAIRAHREHLPTLRFDCGTEDFLIEPNRALHRALEAEGIAHRYEEFSGAHDWPYWEEHVADSFRFFAEHCS